jgi:RimJ/RimL family protein N-acetyltransferase
MKRDFEFLVQLLSDPQMVHYIGNGKPRDREGTLRFYNRIQETYQSDARLGLKLLIRKEDRTPIGHAGLSKH